MRTQVSDLKFETVDLLIFFEYNIEKERSGGAL